MNNIKLLALLVIGFGAGYFSNSILNQKTLTEELSNFEKLAMKNSLSEEAQNDADALSDAMHKNVNASPEEIAEKDRIKSLPLEFEVELTDATGTGLTGFSRQGYIDGRYYMVTEVWGLPPLEGTDFYEGWLIDFGEVENEWEGSMMWTNAARRVETPEGVYFFDVYTSDEDLTYHERYGLTIAKDLIYGDYKKIIK